MIKQGNTTIVTYKQKEQEILKGIIDFMTQTIHLDLIWVQTYINCPLVSIPKNDDFIKFLLHPNNFSPSFLWFG